MNDPFKSDALAGKRILVSGGGTGLGREIATGFSAHGATVYICGRREGVLEETAKAISAQTKGQVIPIGCNLRDPESVERMVEQAWKDGPLTGLVNNAAANFISPTKDLSPRGYEAIRSTVMDGNFYVTLAVGKRWIAGGQRGSIVSNLVTWVWTGGAYTVPSAMAKTALHAMTMSLAVEWGPHGIRVNAVAPGSFPTEGATERLMPTGDTQRQDGAWSKEGVPMRRYGEMEELRNLFTFLMADGCDYLTGQTIAIDGAHHLAAPSTFAGLASMTDAQWKAARESIKATTEREKKARTV